MHALEPLVYEPGPLQTNDEKRVAAEVQHAILDLKVADIAAGSGAFLVAAARYLADRSGRGMDRRGHARSSQHRRTPRSCADRAIREVIARCLYGADINPMAVEMCKLSLWLVSMDKTKPFSFVDDKIFCGNSLLGLTSLDQLRYLHIYPKPSTMEQQLLVDIDAKIAEATRLRQELASPVEEHDPMRSSRGKDGSLAQFRQATADLRLIADGIIAAGLPLGGKPGRQLDDVYKALAWELQAAFPADGSAGDPTKLSERIAAGLEPTVETDYERWEPLHWVIEAPDVIVEHGGFDAIIGNPPFLGVKHIRGAIGQNMRDFLANSLAGGETGRSDLVIHFFLRASALARKSIGLISTDSLAEGDSSRFAVGALLARGWTIWRAEKSVPWPTTSAGVRIAKAWFTRELTPVRLLDGRPVASIGATLLATGLSAEFQPLQISVHVPVPHGYQGTIVLGKSLVLTASEAQAFQGGPLGNRIKPYMSGDDLLATVGPVATRFVIDVGNLSQEALESDPALWMYLQGPVRTERAAQASKYPKLKSRWWGFLNPVSEMYRAMDGLDRVVAFSKHSKHLWPVFVGSEHVFSNGLIVYPTDRACDYGFLASEFHRAWAVNAGGTKLDERHRYNPSRLRSTYPFPEDLGALAPAGDELASALESLCADRQLGVTSALNLVMDPEVNSELVAAVREAMRSLNSAMAQLHGFEDVFGDLEFVPLGKAFRFGLSPELEDRLLSRLVELNHELSKMGEPQ